MTIKHGMTLELPDRQTTLQIEPLTIFKGTDSKVAIPVATPGWRDGHLLAKTAWIFHSVIPGSVVIHSAGVTFENNKDYLVNYNWGSIGLPPTSTITTGTLCDIDYSYTLARIDLVEATSNGVVIVKKGKEDQRVPVIPTADAGSTPLLAVYLSHATMELAEANLLPIDPGTSTNTPVYNAEYLSPFKAKLKAGSPTKVVCIGDSITAGSDAGEDRYVFRLRRYFDKHFPGKVDVINAGVGGDSTRDALKRFDKDVLAQHPDLVIIMFGVNDENFNGTSNDVPVPEYRANLKLMIDTIRQKTPADVILMTTSWKNLGWEHTKGNLNEYADCVKSLGKELHVCVVDNYQAWANLKKRGIPYMNLLNSCINHPTGPGHEIFFKGLVNALEH